MNIQPYFGSDEERAARRLIEQAGNILKGLRGGIPDSFAAQLYAGAVPEDLVRYEARELADMAESAWLFLQERKPGAPKIRFEARSGPLGAERVKSVSIIEILNTDMPFLLDSVMGELTAQGVDARLVLHPIFTVERDHTGVLTGFRGEGPAIGVARRESFIHIHVERIEDEARQAEITKAIGEVLSDVRQCVVDWRPMLSRVGELIAEIKNNPPPLPVDEIAEATQFLEWLVANNFTFLGVREYAMTGDASGYIVLPESGLGILRSPDVHVLRRGDEMVSFTPEIMEFLREPKQLIITKANVRSRVHRRVHMDYIGIKLFNRAGQLSGEFRIVGLFTSTAYTRSTRSIPYLRRKVDALIRRSGFDPDSHSGKAFAAVLENYPRDELFQIDEDTLYGFVLAIMHLDERPRVRVLPRQDRFDRFVSVLVFVPRDRFDSTVRLAIGTYLSNVYRGRVAAFYPFFP
ncbi:MAG: NAD-glutamate dehydrogenase, partial [Alphaproteobacteria bacterium]|nr:NAD-glutamate dehydrogenase [Alphaproteobacteria bacterium]